MTIAFADSAFTSRFLLHATRTEAKKVAASLTGSVVTTEYVPTEVANYLCGTSQHREKFGRLLAGLVADADTLIVESSHDLWQRGVNLYLQRPDKEWSLTDCISFVVMEGRGLQESLTRFEE